MNGHAEALSRSRCSQSADLWCGACHDPHGPAVSYRDRCLRCHEPAACTGPSRGSGDCAGCHMPKSRAHDGGHTVFTDHSIPRRRPPAANVADPSKVELTPYYARPLVSATARRNLGLAYAYTGAAPRAWPLLRDAAQSQPPDPVLYVQLAALLEADGRDLQAIEFYRRALELAPEEDAAMVRLAVLLSRSGDRKEARALAQRALSRNPRQPLLTALLSRIK